MKACTKHWLALRLSAMAMIPLFFYFYVQIDHLASKNRMDFIGWIKQPVTTVAILIFIACAFSHGRMGIDEIIEDYIPDEKQKSAALLVNKIFFAILGLTSVYAVLTIHFRKF